MMAFVKNIVKPFIPRSYRKKLATWFAKVPIKSLEVLPANPYAAYAIPVEYLPSRDFRPRWGYSQKRLHILENWFAQHKEPYRDFVRFMRSLDLSTIGISTETTPSPKPAWVGGAIAAFDSLALYAMVLKHKPKLYLEIGSGMTTCFARQAVVDGKLGTRIMSIDPEPRAAIDAICDEVIRQPLECCDVSIFEQLNAGDILFFDGSHRAFMNSDVTVFFLDILPQLKPGVLVHIHDITLPWDYHEYFKNWYWNEQYMLAVYMMAAMERLDPVLPTAYICGSGEFESLAANPPVDLGEVNSSWAGGGSMWFTHRSQPHR